MINIVYDISKSVLFKKTTVIYVKINITTNLATPVTSLSRDSAKQRCFLKQQLVVRHFDSLKL